MLKAYQEIRRQVLILVLAYLRNWVAHLEQQIATNDAEIGDTPSSEFPTDEPTKRAAENSPTDEPSHEAEVPLPPPRLRPRRNELQRGNA